MDVSAQWKDTNQLLEDFIEELNSNSYNRMEMSFRFRDEFIGLSNSYNNSLDREVIELFDFLRFNLSACENFNMAIRILSEAAILAGFKRVI